MVHPNPQNRASLDNVFASQWFTTVTTPEDVRALFLSRNLELINLEGETISSHHPTGEV
jgi:hypothetical protein